jgi:hypothetical protein
MMGTAAISGPFLLLRRRKSFESLLPRRRNVLMVPEWMLLGT